MMYRLSSVRRRVLVLLIRTGKQPGVIDMPKSIKERPKK